MHSPFEGEYYMTRRALLALKVIRLYGQIHIICGPEKCVFLDHKNEHISKSVSSFDTGPIFMERVGQDLSRNTGLVSVYAF